MDGRGADSQIMQFLINNATGYANRIPNPKHTPKYTKTKVLRTQDKHASAEKLLRALLPLPLPYKKPCYYPIKSLATTL